MMKSHRRSLVARIGVAAVGVGILTAVGAGAAVADEEIDVRVEIDPDAEQGVLAMSVAGNAAELTEQEPAGTDRVFTGTLPTVTVTDTRQPEEITPGTYWYVLGSITNFTGDAGQPDIVSGDTFGWVPDILVGDEGLVAPGDPVIPGDEEDGGFGVGDQELLANIWDSAEGAPGAYSANAALTLQTPGTVEPGLYSATMTLSLIED